MSGAGERWAEAERLLCGDPVCERGLRPRPGLRGALARFGFASRAVPRVRLCRALPAHVVA